MTFQRVLARMTAEHRLLSVLVELTYRCNLDCFFCYNDLGLRGRPLEVEDHLRLVEELAEMQVLYLTLTGGEPLASPSFWPVGRRARELGFVVRVKSNGHALRGVVARRLKDEVDPFLVETSLHGARAETHDRQTRVPGSFVRLMENLDALAEVGVRAKLNSTLTRWNEDELEAMFALADARDLQLSVDPVVTPRDDGDREPLDISPSEDAVRRLYRLVENRALARRARGDAAPEAEVGRHNDVGIPGGGAEKNCGAGASTVAVDPMGNVYPCVQWRRPVGNLHEAGLREIWETSRGLGEARRINEEAGALVRSLGSAGPMMGYCLGMAQEMTGDPVSLYPQAERNLRVARDLEGERTVLPIYGQD